MKNRSTTVVMDKYQGGTKEYSRAIKKIKDGEAVDLIEYHFFPSYRSAAAWILKNRKRVAKCPTVEWRVGDRLGDIIAEYFRCNGDNANNTEYWMTQDFFDAVQAIYDSDDHKRLDAEYMAPLH